MDNVRKECEEEASLPPEVVAAVRPTGLVSYRYTTRKGLSTKARPALAAQQRLRPYVREAAKPCVRGCKPYVRGCTPCVRGCKPCVRGCTPCVCAAPNPVYDLICL